MRPGIALTLAPATTLLLGDELASWCPAFTESLAEMCDAYSRKSIEVTYYATPADVPEGMPIVIGVDAGDQPDALAWHYADKRGVSGAFDLSACAKYGASVTAAIDHETKEAAFDPFINGWKELPSGLLVADERCDPCQACEYSVTAGGVTITASDYVLPSWFDPNANVGPFSRCDGPHWPFSMAKGGYMVTRTSTGEKTVFGSRAPHRVSSVLGRAARR